MTHIHYRGWNIDVIFSYPAFSSISEGCFIIVVVSLVFYGKSCAY